MESPRCFKWKMFDSKKKRANKSVNCSSTQMDWSDLFLCFAFVLRSRSQSPVLSFLSRLTVLPVFSVFSPAPAYQHGPPGQRVYPTTAVFPTHILGLTIWSCRGSGSSAPISGHLLLHLFNYTLLIGSPEACWGHRGLFQPNKALTHTLLTLAFSQGQNWQAAHTDSWWKHHNNDLLAWQ